jgi:hypothetical protein
MESVSPLPTQGAVFFDPRDEGRFLRVSFHEALGVFVLSLWKDDTCLGTFRLPADEAPRLIHAMVGALVGDGEATGSAGPTLDDGSTSVISEALQRREKA